MRGSLSGLALVLAAVCAVSDAEGQRTTEQFIPIGQSPGLSGTATYLGVITRVDSAAQTITVGDSAAPVTIRIVPQTRIWLDRSKQRLPNLTGAFSDLQVRRRVEVKYLHPERPEVADWVKVETTQP